MQGNMTRGSGRIMMRVHHYSIHTERVFCDWIQRYIKFHGMKSRDDLASGEAKIETFLTCLAQEGEVEPEKEGRAEELVPFKTQNSFQGSNSRVF